MMLLSVVSGGLVQVTCFDGLATFWDDITLISQFLQFSVSGSVVVSVNHSVSNKKEGNMREEGVVGA